MFDDQGSYKGFLSEFNSRLQGSILGADGLVAGRLLRDGSIQNPDGTCSSDLNPVEYLLKREYAKPEKPTTARFSRNYPCMLPLYL
ncbi:hypothetical protein HZB02_04915 [Candidatus Woesearchaeota archaeon]|nr:hypothetical protein [Candidatus Woesearchaeota archaeon]